MSDKCYADEYKKIKALYDQSKRKSDKKRYNHDLICLNMLYKTLKENNNKASELDKDCVISTYAGFMFDGCLKDTTPTEERVIYHCVCNNGLLGIGVKRWCSTDPNAGSGKACAGSKMCSCNDKGEVSY
jgi:hypothetical protein